ncbi:MAG: hypothetical protein PHN75_20075 [Syntrophales bacterium]|nr:hypothetical protein [Syntrophales bacterium]
MKPVSLIVMVFLIVIAIAQFLRFALQVEIMIGGFTVPVWVSLVASVIAAGLAAMLWHETRRK